MIFSRTFGVGYDHLSRVQTFQIGNFFLMTVIYESVANRQFFGKWFCSVFLTLRRIKFKYLFNEYKISRIAQFL